MHAQWRLTMVDDAKLAKEGKVNAVDQPHQLIPSEVTMLQEKGTIKQAVASLSHILDDRASEKVGGPVRALLVALQEVCIIESAI